MPIVESMLTADLLLRNARIVDGTGSPWIKGDVAVTDGRLSWIGPSFPGEAAEEHDLDGAVVAPGFIDIHTHSDFTLPANPEAHSKVRQGVTFEVLGNCGTSAAPRYGDATEAVDDWFERNGLTDVVDTEAWNTMADYLDTLDEMGLSLNIGSLVGHGNVRAATIGYEDRAPTDNELAEMCSLVDEALSDGAMGLSTGLFYPPGSYADIDEVVALAEVVAEHGAIYTTHMRSESDGLIESVEESIEIGRRSGAPVQISHHKAIGPENWGKVRYTLRLMERARQEGIDVQCDQYPYIASSTSLGALLPTWAHDGGTEALLERLRDEETRQEIKEGIETEKWSTWNDVLITRVRDPDLQEVQGKTIAEIADAPDETRDPADILLDIVLHDENKTSHVNFGMEENDVREVMDHELTMVGSDGSSLATSGPLGEGVPHPRNYGTFPHVLGTYARDESVLSMERAVQKMTGLPAARLGLTDRGVLKEGLAADLVVFDPETIEQTGTFLEPAQFPAGIDHVIVNGTFVIRNREHTSARPGTVVR